MYVSGVGFFIYQVYENKIDYPRAAIKMSEPMKRGGSVAACVLLIKKDKYPKKFPTTLP